MVVFYVSANILSEESKGTELLVDKKPYTTIEEVMAYVTYVQLTYNVVKIWVDEYRNNKFYQRVVESEG